MDHLTVPGDIDDISLASISPDLSSESVLESGDEEDIEVSDIETIDSAADFKLEVCYVIFTHLKKVIGWTSPLLRITEVVVVISVYVSIITATFLIAFHHTYMPVLAFFYASDSIFVLHLLFISFIALSPATAWSTPSQLAFRQKCRLDCLIDLVTVIPLELMLGQLMETRELKISKYIGLNYVALGRLNRLLRMHRLIRFFKHKKNDVILGTRYSDMLSAACALSLLIHISACIWYLMGCKPFTSQYSNMNICWSLKEHGLVHASNTTVVYSNFEYHPINWEPHSWTLDIFKVSGSDDKHFSFVYIISAYWATVTALSVGYGDYRGLNFDEIRFSMLVMLLGSAIINGLVVGNLTSLLTNVEGHRASFAHRLMIIRKYLEDNKYSKELSDTILGFYEYMWFKKRGQNEHNIYEALPPSLQSEICLSVNQCALGRSPMFKNLDEGFLRSIALKIHSHFYLPGQIVISKGAVSRCMYYVVRGELEVLSDRDNETPVAVLRPGKLFGEVNLVLNFARTATIRAATHCDLLILNQHDVTSVLLHYPEARIAMWEYIQALFEMDFNEQGGAANHASPSENELSMPRSEDALATPSIRFAPTRSPTAESEKSIEQDKRGSSATKIETHGMAVNAKSPGEDEGPDSSRFPPISTERNKSHADVVQTQSSVPVFKETKSLAGHMSTLRVDSASSLTQNRANSSTLHRLSRPSAHIVGSSQKVALGEMIVQKGDEPIPAFEKPDELHNVESLTSQPSAHFNFKQTQHVDRRKQIRRPTIIDRPKGTAEVTLGKDCAVFKSTTSTRRVPLVRRLLQHMEKPCILEDSAFDKAWKTCVWIVVLLQWFVYLYHASFEAGYSPAALLFTYCLDAVHVLDLIFSMMTVVITPRETYETYRQIFSYRAGTVAFYMDIVAALPLDLILLPFTVDTETARRSQLLTICKLNKLTKAWVIYKRFRYFDDQLYVPLQVLRPIETVIYILMGAHLSACVWYMDANFGHILTDKPKSDRWLSEFLRMKEEEKSIGELSVNNSKYILALYWAAATMSTTGYGDIIALSTIEYCISILTMVLGLILFSYTLAAYASLLTNIDKPKVQFQSIVFAMEQFMIENRLSKHLRKRVLRYMSVQWNAYDGLIMPGKQSLLHDLPEALQQDLAADGVVKLLDSVPLFHGTDSTFRQELSSRCSRYLFPPNELVLYSGDLGRDMYIIIRGYCESFIGNRQKSLGLMGPGEYFGEGGMLFGLPRPAYVMTRTHCSLLAIPHGEFQRIMKKFPTVNMEIRDIQDNPAILRTVKLNHARVWRLSKDLPPSDDSLFPPEQPPSFTTFPEKDSSEAEYRRPFAELGHLGSCLTRLLMPRTVRPDGKAAVLLQCFRIITIVITLFLTPVHITFACQNLGVYALGIFLDIITMGFVYLRLHWAYYDATSKLITHPAATAQNYLASAFLLDLVGCFPFDLLAMLFFEGNIRSNLHVIILFRLNRMLQVYEIFWAFNHWERRMVFRGGIFKVVKYLWYFVTYVHIISCVWAYIACPAWLSSEKDGVQDIESRFREYHLYNKTKFAEKHFNCRAYSWYSMSNFAHTTSRSYELYIISIMFTLEMVMSVGYGDTTPQTRIEFILAILLMLHGVVHFGYIIASVTASFVNADMSRANFNERVKDLSEQMQYELVPKPLQRKVLKHVEYQFFRSQGMEAHALFTNLPPSIRGDVAIVLFEGLISSVPIFKTIDRSFHRMLAMCLKEAFFLEGETVIYAGDMGEEMFFIHRGTCEIVDADGKPTLSLGPGRFFGEVSVMFSIPRTVTIKARTNADLFVLKKNDLQDVLENYPDIKREIEHIAIERLQDAGQRKAQTFEQQSTSHAREAGGLASKRRGSSLMETRHGRKHKTHHRRSFVEQLTGALMPHGSSKNHHGEIKVNARTLEDEYKTLLRSEEGEKDQRRRSSQTLHIKQFMQRIFSHSNNIGPEQRADAGGHTEAAKYTKSTLYGKVSEDSKPKDYTQTEMNNKLKTDKRGEDGRPKMSNDYKANNETAGKNNLKEKDERNLDDSAAMKEIDSNAKEDEGNDINKAEIVIIPSEEESLTQVLLAQDVPEPGFSHTGDISGLQTKTSNGMDTPKLPRIDSKHLSKSLLAEVSEDSTRDESLHHSAASGEKLPVITLSLSEDDVSMVSRDSSRDGGTAAPSQGRSKSEGSRSMEGAGPVADEYAGVSSAEKISCDIEEDLKLHEIQTDSSAGFHESNVHDRKGSQSVNTSVQHKSSVLFTGKTSAASISSLDSTRSEFRPPAWLDNCVGSFARHVHKIISPDFIIKPESKLLFVFNFLLALLGLLSIMIIFYQLAFSDFNEHLNSALLAISLAYTINIYLRMHTAFYDSYGDLVCDRNKVKKKYFRQPTGLLIDALSAMPIGLLIFISPDSLELSHAIHKVRFGQLVRFYTVFRFFRSWEGVLKAPVLLLRSLRDVGFLLLLLHIWGCLWYMAACPAARCLEDSWINIRKLENSTNHEKYVNSVYFIAATMTSTGYGEIHPGTMQEVIVCIAAIFFGKFAIGLIIGDLASTLSNLEVARVDMETMMAVIVNQMKDQMVPKHLQERVRQHCEYDWLRNRGHSLRDLLQHVPYCLRMEVFDIIYGTQLRSISIFESAPDYLIRRLSALCEQQVFLPGDFITKRGDIGRRVFIIRRGSVMVYRSSPAAPDYFLYSGSIYGDVQIVYPTLPYEHHLVADYPSDVLVIHQADIQLLLADDPQFFFKVRRYIQKKYPDVTHDKRPSMAVRASVF